MAGFLKYIAPSAYFSDDKECFAFFYSHFPFFFRSMAVDSASKTPYTDATQVRNPMTRVVVRMRHVRSDALHSCCAHARGPSGRARACVRTAEERTVRTALTHTYASLVPSAAFVGPNGGGGRGGVKKRCSERFRRREGGEVTVLQYNTLVDSSQFPLRAASLKIIMPNN